MLIAPMRIVGVRECKSMGARQPTPTRAAIRFSHFVGQLKELGLIADQKDFARAIGRSPSLVSNMVRLETAGRSGLTDLTIQGIVDAYEISSDFLFLSDEQIAQRFGDRAKVVALPDGTTRPCKPGEVDAQLFSLSHQRDVENEKKLREQGARLDSVERKLDAIISRLTPPRAQGQ